jgi:metal-dependent amidase/aminoacylase/carboxypeptidase family protein
VRTFDEALREDVHRRIRLTAENIAEASGATAEVTIEKPYAVTINNIALTEHMLPTLKRVAGEENVILRDRVMGSEDFSFFAQRAPGLFVWLGGSPKGIDLSTAASNHSPRFFIDESSLLLGVRALTHLTLDYMKAPLR